jgi:hypothetical protein
MENLLTSKEVATLLNTSEANLANWRCQKKWLSYIKIGKSVRYKKEEVERFINLVSSAKDKTDKTIEVMIKCYNAELKLSVINMLALSDVDWFEFEEETVKQLSMECSEFFGYVYIIEYKDNYFKIGKSTNIHNRINTLRSEAKNHRREIVKIIFSKPHINYSSNETKILSYFRKKSDNPSIREYVLTSWKEINNILQQINFDNSIESLNDIRYKNAQRENVCNLITSKPFKEFEALKIKGFGASSTEIFFNFENGITQKFTIPKELLPEFLN